MGDAHTKVEGHAHLTVEREGPVSVLRFADPSTRNACTADMASALRRLIKAEAQTARAIIIAGDAKAFCSGANLTGGELKGDVTKMDAGAALENDYNPLMQTIRDLEVPVVTAVRGAAAGVGASIALAGDIVVAGKSAFFLEAFARIGLVPDGGATWLLTHTVGRIRAMEMMLLAERIPAEQAHAWGLVTRLVEDDQVDATAMELAQKLAAGPTRTLALIRRAAWDAAETGFADTLRREREFQRQAGRSPDFLEGVTAFREKRAARFGG